MNLTNSAKLLDLSVGGFSCTCDASVSLADSIVKIDIVLLDQDFYLPNLLCKKVDSKRVPGIFTDGNKTIRHYRFKFIDIDSEVHSILSDFIKN